MQRGRRPWAAVAFALIVAVLSLSTATDRLRRSMDEHPGQPDGAPIAAAAVVYDFLNAQAGRDSVLAPPNFSELVPALTGKPVVAFPERGTLVFATDEVRAYERLRDRATFFRASAGRAERDEVADRYGVRWAVLPRRQVASGSEGSWLWRFGPEALLAARVDDDATPTTGDDGRWWSATAAGVAAHLSPAWSIVVDTRDYFVVERRGARSVVAAVDRAAVDGRGGHGSGVNDSGDGPRWLRPFALPPADQAAASPGSDRVLATATDTPGSELSFASAPRYVRPTVLPVWADGPAAWEDVPGEAAITLDLGVACRVSAVEVIPHLPRERRDVLELRVNDAGSVAAIDAGNDAAVRSVAVHGIGILVPIDASSARRRVTLRAASLIGNPISLADVRLIGDPAGCEGAWPVHRKPVSPQLAAGGEALLALASGHPPGGRALVSLARHAALERGKRASVDLLAEATRRQPSLVEAWIDLGFAHEDLAAAAESPEQAEAERAAALAAFEGAVTADSNSAWARGALAWARRGAGDPVVAIVDALAAAQLDPMYADAWTVLGYALGDLGLDALAERALVNAESIDPARNWPALAKADLAVARGDFEAARIAMRAWLRRHPFDEAARAKISAIAAAEASRATTGEIVTE